MVGGVFVDGVEGVYFFFVVVFFCWGEIMVGCECEDYFGVVFCEVCEVGF